MHKMRKSVLLLLPSLLLMASCRMEKPQKPADDPGDTVPASVFEPDTLHRSTPQDSLVIDATVNILDADQPQSRKPRSHKAAADSTATE